jgi:hypothetical protein
MPDDALFQAVDSGLLKTKEDVAREARRLFSDPRAQDTIVDFVLQWLHLPLSPANDLGRSAQAETAAFVKKVLTTDGLLQTLLTSPTNFADQSLAEIYGAEGVTGTNFNERVIDPSQRFGLLTQVNFLGTNADGPQSHPVKRGNIIYKQVICGHLPEVPLDVPQPDAPREDVSNRERFAIHSNNPCATGCHGVLDPLGFAFENYDGRGEFRTEDGGEAVDASGSVTLPDGTSWTWQDARGLVDALAASEQVRNCVATQWLRFTLARQEIPADKPSVDAIQSTFAAAGYDLRELFVAATQTPSFLYRSSNAGGAL